VGAAQAVRRIRIKVRERRVRRDMGISEGVV
jgi:hypothetical protein